MTTTTPLAGAPDNDSATTIDDGLAWPRDFDARYGDGMELGVSLGGGGVFFVAWQVAYLHEIAEQGIDLRRADRLVGTSAGSIVASVVGSGHLDRFFREVVLLSKAPKLVAALAPTGDLHTSQTRARNMFGMATADDPATLRSIGHSALAAQAPAAAATARNVAFVLGSRRWPSSSLHISCVDTYSGERCVVTKSSKVGIGRAVAASSAVPGLFAPQQIGDRRCMDGGVSGTGTHLDLIAGAGRAVVLSLTDGSGDEAMMTMPAGAAKAEFASLRDSGTEVFSRQPEQVDVNRLMDPKAIPDAVAMGKRQAADDADALRSFVG